MIRTGKTVTRWRLVIEGANPDPSDLLHPTRVEIATAIVQGEQDGEVTEDVMYSDVGEGSSLEDLQAAGIQPDPDDPRVKGAGA